MSPQTLLWFSTFNQRPPIHLSRHSCKAAVAYEHNGALTVKELAAQTYWPARQINRYFSQQFGMPLEAYSNILRFRASFGHIKQGKLFPEENFFDQAHFIKEVKKLAGVLPKQLRENKNDRFLQFSALDSTVMMHSPDGLENLLAFFTA